MRDIVSSGYNSSTLPTKSKVVRMNSGTARGEYKSYRDFVGSYGDKNSKDDQESVSSTDSGISSSCKLSESKSNNTSTSSLNSEINGSSSKVSQKSESNLMTTRTGSFRNYMESYNNKKFSSVKPTVAPTQNIIKSEILIQVNDPLEQPRNKPEKVFMTTIDGDVLDKGEDKTDAAINTVPRPSLGNYKEIKMALSQCFESQHELNNKINGTTNSSQSQLELHNDETNKILPPPPPPPEPKINCGDRHGATNDFIPPPPPPPILNLNNQQLKHTTAKKWETVKVNNSDSSANQQNPPEKLPSNNAAAANLAKILTQHLLPRRKELERLEQNETTNGATTSSSCETTLNGSKSQGIEIKNQKCKTYVSVIPKLPSQSENKQPPKLPSSPPPPVPKEQQSPPIFMQSKSFVPSSPVLTKQVRNGENSAPSKFPVFSPTMSRRMQNVDTSLPKPPLKQSQKIADLQKSFSFTTVTSEVPRLPKTPPPKITSGRNSPNLGGNVEFSTTTVVPITDTTTKVSKNDPNVRKLVYNTYRGLLGAYNNKANDMIATLPRNMVREDKGVAKQLESIAQAAAPAPPPGAVGHIPSTRLKSEISDRRVEPPLCVQNAMLTKDKKPFTYTPGGIDLSEIRSPRMARRLELNAMNEGVAPLPQTQPHHPTGPLPPSALAAMQPQLPVQVFPAGGIPQPHHHGGGPPPPPPPPSGVPPPPPKAPPMRSSSPVPLDSFERPDMTKIIPENPMALLRKTSGPVIKRDPIFNKENFGSGNRVNDVANYSPPVRQPSQKVESPPVRQPESPQKTSTAGVGSIYVPPVNQNAGPATPPNRQPQSPQFINQGESPPTGVRAPPAYYKRQPSTPQQEPQSPQFTAQKQPPAASSPPQREPQSPESPKVSLSKAPTPWLQKRQQQQEVPEWAVTNQPAPSPPIVQEQQQQKLQTKPDSQQQWQQQQSQSAPWRQQQQQQYQPETQQWQQRQQQQPDPQPWQQRQQQQSEPQSWQRQQQPESQPLQQRQQQQPQTPPWQQQQSPPIHIPKGGGVRNQVQMRENPQESGPTERTAVVIVNEPPQVFQHPGPTQRIIIRQQQPQQNNYQQEQRMDSPGIRVIPVQIEAASSNGHGQPQVYVHKFSSPGGTPSTPGSNSDARSLNRQLSWNSNPTQSNTFRVLQKITNTDGEDDEDQPITAHSPKTPHHFPQRQLSTEQVRKLKQNESDQELMSKFKQGLDQDSSLHREVDPRYRGPDIPSKAFKLLQSMTGGSEDPSNSFTVPQSQPNNTQSGPKVRTIPIQIEGDGPPKKYIPPSEQTVPEPKKYMGSAIPSRSFKILQAMTGPDDCANPVQACENNENYANDPSSYTQWGFDPNYPPPSPYFFDPYWSFYSQNYAPPNNEFAANNNSRMTPVPPAWGYYPSPYPQNNVASENSDSGSESSKKRSSRTTPVPWTNDNNESSKKPNGNARCTPVPFWPYYYPNYTYDNTKTENNQEAQQTDTNGNAANTEEQNYPQYPPYWDPYYYSYYYGAPPPMYPPVYSPYPFYPPPQTDSEEVSGYSSDEMAYYGAKFASMPPTANKKPRSTETPSLQKQLLQEITETANKMDEKRKKEEVKQKTSERIRIQSEPFDDDSSIAETSDSESEMIGYEVCRQPNAGLKAIRSVSDIKVYDAEESSQCSDDDLSEDTTEENDDTSSVCAAEETIPHQLSVIFEESERTDSAGRYVRESSVATTISEGTATMENSEDEEETAESDGTVLVKLPLTFKFNVAENEKVATLVVGNSEIKPQVDVYSAALEQFENSEVLVAINKNEGEENLLMVDNSITRQVSSDSYQTAESDAEAFNTQNSNIDVSCKSIEVQNKNEEDDIDWWGQLGKDDDLPKLQKKDVTKTTESITSTNIREEKECRSHSINITDSNKEDRYDVTTENEGDVQKYLSEDEYEALDVWSENRCVESTLKVQSEVKKPNTKGTETYLQCDEVDFWAQMQDDHDDITKNSKCKTVSNSDTEKKEEKKNDPSMKKGMETVETVLTNIISTLNRRTSISCSSEEEKWEEVDFWGEINNLSEQSPKSHSKIVSDVNIASKEENIDTGSACSRNSSLSSSKVSYKEENVVKPVLGSLEKEAKNGSSYEICIKTEVDDQYCSNNTNYETDKTCNNCSNNDEVLDPEFKPLSVQERIKALQESATYKQNCQQEEEEEEAEIKVSVKDRISVFEDTNALLNVNRAGIHKRKSMSRKSSIKSYEEYSEEEEGDSGVTSDISRHISETDTEADFLDLKKLNQYQRASTHSRLFKLLQDECDSEDVPEDSIEPDQNTSMQSRREHLNLPLRKNGSDPESFSSSGFTSPGSPTVNERLVNELIQSLLRKKQGKVFKNMTMEKIQAAALRILQEDMDGLETLSSSEDGGSFLSPKKPETRNSTPAQTPQEFSANFNEYSQYYDTWAEAARLYEAQCDLVPSKAFKLLQEHAATNRTGAIAGLLARCPRVLSNKNVQKELMRLMENHESPSPSPEPHQQPPHANEATNAS